MKLRYPAATAEQVVAGAILCISRPLQTRPAAEILAGPRTHPCCAAPIRR